MQFLVNSLTLQVLNTHRAEAGGEERNKASLQFCLPCLTISTEDCPSSTPCCPQQFYTWFWFKTSLHYSACISVLLHVVGLVLQDQSQGTFWGGSICFHISWPIRRSGIFTQFLQSILALYFDAYWHSSPFRARRLSYTEHWNQQLLLCQAGEKHTSELRGAIWLLAFHTAERLTPSVCKGVTRNAIWLKHQVEGEANLRAFVCCWK